MERKRFRVLIADDERIARENMRQYIPWESLGMEIYDAVENGALALDCLKKGNIDLLIMDIRMPVMDGLELLESIRRLGIQVLVIVLSAFDQFEYAQKAIRSRMVFEYVLKPVKRKDFCALLTRAAETLAERGSPIPAQPSLPEQATVLAQFPNHIARRDMEGALQTLEAYARGVNPADDEQMFDLKRLMLNLFTETRLFLSRDGVNCGPYLYDYDLLNDLNQCAHPEELMARFSQLMEELRPFLEQSPTSDTQSKAGALIRYCVEEIQKHYIEPDFSLYQLAEKMQLSTNYLSSLFKKEMGVGYVRYINTLRIDKAKSLLLDMRYRTGEVASMVGIENPRYFTRVFKEMTGLTPAEYRAWGRSHTVRSDGFKKED